MSDDQDTTDGTNQNTDSTQRNTEARNENKKATDEQTDSIKKFLEFQEKSKKLSTEQIELEFDYLRAVGDTNTARQKYTELLKQLEQNQAAYTAQGHEYIDLLKQEGPLSEEQLKRKEKIQKEIGKEAKAIEKNIALTKKLTEAKKELGGISDEDQERTENLAKTFESMTMGLIKMDDGIKHPIRGLGALAVSLAKGDDKAQIFTEALGKVFGIGNIAASVFDTVKNATIGMANAFDNAAAQFSKTTGLAREYSTVLEGVQRSGSQFSVSAAEGGQAMAGLLANFSDFHKTAPAVQKDLALNVAQLSKFGVSTEQSARVMQIFTRTMGMSGKESVEMTKKIGMMGTKIGITTGKMLKDYESSLKTLAVYGDKSIDVFTGIAAAAKAAGVETGTLLGMVEKFDTFSGAAETAGKLNAILGSQMSATEMLMMKEDDRLKTMISTMQATGQSFGSMDKFTQKAIAQAAGISDMAEANKIFGMSLGEYENYEMQMKQANDTQKRFEDALKSMQPFMEKLSVLANQFAGAFLPVLNALIVPLEGLIGLFAAANEKTDGLFGTIVGGLAGFTLFVKGMGGLARFTGLANLQIFKSIGLSIKKFAADKAASVMAIFRGGQRQQEIVQEEIRQRQQQRGIIQQQVANQTAAAGVVPMLALAASIALIGGGIYDAATGLAEFVKAFAGLTGPQLLAATIGLIVFTLAFVGLIAVLAALVTGPQAAIAAGALGFLLGVGAAALMIGGGIYLAATGMAAFIKSLSGLTDMSKVFDALTGAKDVAVEVTLNGRLQAMKKFMDEVKDADIKAELENIALITTGTSASLMTKNAVSQLVTVASLADQIKNIFNADIVINIDGDAVADLFEDGVYKTSMGNK